MRERIEEGIKYKVKDRQHLINLLQKAGVDVQWDKGGTEFRILGTDLVYFCGSPDMIIPRKGTGEGERSPIKDASMTFYVKAVTFEQVPGSKWVMLRNPGGFVVISTYESKMSL